MKNLSTNAVTRVADTDMQETSPRWSPDGRAIAGWDQRSMRGGVFVIPRGADGKWGRLRMLAPQGTIPAWSPDGRMLAFAAPDGSVEIMPSDSGARRVIFHASGRDDDPIAQDVRWSAANNVVYVKGRDYAGRGGLWAIPSDGGPPKLLVRLDDPRHPSDRPDFIFDATSRSSRRPR